MTTFLARPRPAQAFRGVFLQGCVFDCLPPLPDPRRRPQDQIVALAETLLGVGGHDVLNHDVDGLAICLALQCHVDSESHLL